MLPKLRQPAMTAVPVHRLDRCQPPPRPPLLTFVSAADTVSPQSPIILHAQQLSDPNNIATRSLSTARARLTRLRPSRSSTGRRSCRTSPGRRSLPGRAGSAGGTDKCERRDRSNISWAAASPRLPPHLAEPPGVHGAVLLPVRRAVAHVLVLARQEADARLEARAAVEAGRRGCRREAG